MGIRSVFRRLSGKPPISFDEINTMATRRIPLPDAGKKDAYIKIISKKDSTGQWRLCSPAHNFEYSVMPVHLKEDLFSAISLALYKHTGDGNLDHARGLNFDATFMILRDLEEAYMHRDKTSPEKEPLDHYMVAYRLLPKKYAEGLDDLFQVRLEKGPALLRSLLPQVQPATKTPDAPGG